MGTLTLQLARGRLRAWSNAHGLCRHHKPQSPSETTQKTMGTKRQQHKGNLESKMLLNIRCACPDFGQGEQVQRWPHQEREEATPRLLCGHEGLLVLSAQLAELKRRLSQLDSGGGLQQRWESKVGVKAALLDRYARGPFAANSAVPHSYDTHGTFRRLQAASRCPN